jgi:hypothetical protein
MIDTLASLKQLVAAGMEETQAEAVVKVVNADKDQLATKADLEALQSATKADLEALRSATKADIAALRSATKADLEALRSELKQFATKNDMLLLAGFQVAVISLAVAIIKLF